MTTRWRNFDNPPVLEKLQNCMGENLSLRLLVIGDNNLVAHLGAQGGFSTLMEPSNMARRRYGFYFCSKIHYTMEYSFCPGDGQRASPLGNFNLRFGKGSRLPTSSV